MIDTITFLGGIFIGIAIGQVIGFTYALYLWRKIEQEDREIGS